MSVTNLDPHKQEIIIVRRGGGDGEDGHHGGVWKIAFADFMTAMMAFFLVMWLVNAANEETKASVASYFNPVKLIDRNSSRKGLEDIGDGPNAAGTTDDSQETPRPKAGTDGAQTSGPSEQAPSKDKIENKRHSDESLFSDPYAVLAEIAAETGNLQNVSAKGEGGAQDSGPATGASGGESFRDPFAPDFWSQQVAAPVESVELVDESQPSREGADRAALGAPDTGPEPLPDTAAAPEPRPESGPPAEAHAAAQEQARRISEEIAAAFSESGRLPEGIEVGVRASSVVISVTEQLEFGMFEIGSAVPRRELVLAMDKIGRVIKEQPGRVGISGHTDARQFTSGDYDNWRLSTARAHAAYYMLIRTGLAEERVSEISGMADRRLKFAQDPLAAGNRRIEITLESDG